MKWLAIYRCFWLAVNAVLRMGAAADRRESRGLPAGVRGAIFDAMSGH